MKRTTSFDQEKEEGSPRKKLRLTKHQSDVLEDSFKHHSTLNTQALAKQLNLRPRQVEVWFQNRRARTKLKQTEMECDELNKQCEKLTEDNKRLQKELHELKNIQLFRLQLAFDRNKFMEVLGSGDNVKADIETFLATFLPLLQVNHKFLAGVGLDDLKAS